jgi:hypothetical protein
VVNCSPVAVTVRDEEAGEWKALRDMLAAIVQQHFARW